jgi:geranylgeranyl reductase family protein
MAQTYDVLVIGAGPSGCTAARDLALAGWNVGLLEQQRELGGAVNCSGVIGIEPFRRYDLPANLIRHTLQTLDFRSPGGIRWRFRAKKPLAHAVDRSRLDRLLGLRAQEAGVDLLLDHRVKDLEPAPTGVSIHVLTPESVRPRTLYARSVVIATGAGAPLLQNLGWGFPPGKLFGVQTELSLEAASVEVHLGRKWAPEGFAWIIPIGEGRAKIGLLCRETGPRYMRRFLERRDIRSRIRGEAGPIRCSVLPLGFPPTSYGDRILLVGEAAGHIKATTCGGIYYGMLTAGMAAEVLNDALNEDLLDAARLSIYEKRWRSRLEEEIEMGMLLRRALNFAGDSILDRLVSMAGQNGIAKLIQDHADFDWHRGLIREVLRHSAIGCILGPFTVSGKKSPALTSQEAMS